mgnify:CR=1 FL=1
MALSTNTYTYTGGAQTFAVNFALGFIQRSDVTVRINNEVDGSGDPVYSPFTWIDDSAVSVTQTLTVGDTVEVLRTVSKEELKVSFAAGADITPSNLDLSAKHGLMVYQELVDNRVDGAESPLVSAARAEAAAIAAEASGVSAAAAVVSTNADAAAAALSASNVSIDQGVSTTDSPTFAGLTVDTDTLFVDVTNNRLGVGTTSPNYTLDVQGIGDTIARIYTAGTTSSDDAMLFLAIGGTTATSRLNFGDANDADAGRIIYGHSGDYMSFTTAASEAMRITSSGKVGIGDTSPSEALSVTGNIEATGSVTAGDFIGSASNPTLTSADADGYLAISGDSTIDTGANIRLFGASHATNAGDFSVRNNTTTALKHDSSASLWNFQANDVTTTGTVTATDFAGDGSALTGIAASAGGGGNDEIFWENGQNVTTNYTVTNNKNAMSAGPITIDNGVTVTVGDGETWTVI